MRLSCEDFTLGQVLDVTVILLLNHAAVGWAVSCSAFGLLLFFFSFVGDYIQTSADDVIISQLQAISQLFSSYPPLGAFCQVSKLTIQTEHGRP